MVITYVSWITLEFFNVTFFFNQVAFPHFMDAVFICVIFFCVCYAFRLLALFHKIENCMQFLMCSRD